MYFMYESGGDYNSNIFWQYTCCIGIDNDITLVLTSCFTHIDTMSRSYVSSSHKLSIVHKREKLY